MDRNAWRFRTRRFSILWTGCWSVDPTLRLLAKADSRGRAWRLAIKGRCDKLQSGGFHRKRSVSPVRGRVAQEVEHLPFKQRVPGSNPGALTNAFNELGDCVHCSPPDFAFASGVRDPETRAAHSSEIFFVPREDIFPSILCSQGAVVGTVGCKDGVPGIVIRMEFVRLAKFREFGLHFGYMFL